MIRIEIDRNQLTGSVNLVGADGEIVDLEFGKKLLDDRQTDATLQVDSAVPDETRLWSALQQLGGGTWGGCVFDVKKIIEKLES